MSNSIHGHGVIAFPCWLLQASAGMMLLLIISPVLLNIVCVGSALAAILTFKGGSFGGV